MCGKQTEIEPECSTANKCALPEAKTIHTTQANEINVCAEWQWGK